MDQPTDLRVAVATDLERRSAPIAWRDMATDGEEIVGYAAVFGEKSIDMGGFVEMIAPGAFRRSLAEGADIRALWNHDNRFVLGRTRSGTLVLEEDERGLRVRIRPPNATWARDALESIRRGDVDQMSFAFRVVRDEWRTEIGVPLRILHDVDLYEVSPVTFPAYPQTTVAVQRRAEELRAQPPSVPDERRVPLDIYERRLRAAVLGTSNPKGE